MARFHQGKFQPRFADKYVGDAANIVYRSAWEFKFMKWLDGNPSVISWASEELFVPYNDRSTNKLRRYFPDFIVKIKKPDGSIETWMVEIKPLKETMPPVKGKKKERAYLKEVKTFATNYSKWESAKRFCEKNNMKFVLITEKELNL